MDLFFHASSGFSWGGVTIPPNLVVPSAERLGDFSDRLRAQHFRDSLFMRSLGEMKRAPLEETSSACGVATLRRMGRAYERLSPSGQMNVRIAGTYMTGIERLEGVGNVAEDDPLSPLLGVVGPDGKGARRFHNPRFQMKDLFNGGSFLKSTAIFDAAEQVRLVRERAQMEELFPQLAAMSQRLDRRLDDIWDALTDEEKRRIGEQINALRGEWEVKAEPATSSSRELRPPELPPVSTDVLFRGHVKLMVFRALAAYYGGAERSDFSKYLLEAVGIVVRSRSEEEKQLRDELWHAGLLQQWLRAAVWTAPLADKGRFLAESQLLASGLTVHGRRFRLDAAANFANSGDLEKAEKTLRLAV